MLAILLLAGIFLLTDRPFRGSGYEAEDIQTSEEASRMDMWNYYDVFSVGMSKRTNFGPDAKFNHPRIEFNESPNGGWDAKLVITVMHAKEPGTIVLVLPKRAQEILPTVIFSKADLGPTIETRLPFAVSQEGEHRVVRLSYKPKELDSGTREHQKQDEAADARDFANSTLGVGFHMPSLRDRRLGWGKQEIKIAYSPISTYKHLVPLAGGSEDNDSAVAKIPFEVMLLFDADRYIVTTAPEAKAVDYNSRSWDMTSTDQPQILQVVMVNQTWRWWVDHAPDVLFLVIGIFLGDWLATKESVGAEA